MNDINYIDKIFKEYNVNIITKLESTNKKFIQRIITYLKQNNIKIKDKTIVSLLYNQLYNSNLLPTTEYITGPYTVSYNYIPSLDKTIYIFGENHHYIKPCNSSQSSIFIHEYLEQLLKYTSSFIDLYLEDFEVPITDIQYNVSKEKHKNYIIKKGGKEQLIRSNEGIISYLSYMFLECIQHKETELCINSRVHYADIRYIWHDYLHDSVLYKSIVTVNKMRNKYEDDIVKGYRDIHSLRTIKEVHTKLLNKNFYKYILKELYKHPKIIKETDKIKDINIKNKIKEYFTTTTYYKELIYTHITTNNISKLVKNLPEVSDNNIILIHYHLSDILSQIETMYMDLYLLTRIFIDFDMTKNGKISYGPSKQNNIIIYTGNFHSKSYRLFFEYLNQSGLKTTSIISINKEASLTQVNNLNCVPMTNIPQPFFSI